MPEERSVIVDEKLDGERLDRILRQVLPSPGLRECRRLIENGFVTLNGVRTSPAARPTKGSRIEISQPTPPQEYPQPFEIESTDSYSFFFKPRGLHSAAIAGSSRPSLEFWLQGRGQLLQRLDFNTCGIVCAARNEAAARDFRNWEKGGACHKWYLCLLSGKMREPMLSRARLDMADRRKTKVAKGCGNALQFTLFWPLPELETPVESPGVWALAMILRGQRHQIRAHASGLGHALVNDGLYGEGNGSFYLRHFLLEFPGHKCFYLEEEPGSFRLPQPEKSLTRLLVEKTAEASKWVAGMEKREL